ncbi:MAG: histidine phosphatase family protein, partial [bacterium]|nr:histidine phosphatase family protein [bacterium]
GEAQVRGAAERAVPWLAGEVLLFSSPRVRAMRSAEILRAALPVALAVPPPEAVPELAELDLGEWEGESYASLQEKSPERLAAHYADFVRARPPGGESLADLAARVRPAFAALRERARGRAALIVAHAAVNRIILCDALGVPLENFFRLDQGAAALNVLDFYADGACVLRLLNG